MTPLSAEVNITHGICELRGSCPRRVALTDGARQQTFAELDQRLSRLACALLAACPRFGEGAAIRLPTRLEYIEIAAGFSKAGLVMMPLNFRAAAREHPYVVEHNGAPALASDAALAPEALDAFARGRLAGLKVPREWHSVSTLGPTATCRVIRARLRSHLPDGVRVQDSETVVRRWSAPGSPNHAGR